MTNSALDAWRDRHPRRWRKLLAVCQGDEQAAESLWLDVHREGLSEARGSVVRAERARCIQLARMAAAVGTREAADLAISQVDAGTTPEQARLEHLMGAAPGDASLALRLRVARSCSERLQ